jgi:hypothetical protein
MGLGLAAQVRTMGSAFGLAIVTSVLNGYTVPRLQTLGISGDITQYVLEGGHLTLPSELQSEVRSILSEGYNRQMIVLCAFSAAQIPTAFFLWRSGGTQIVTA